jgi:hypothetical protein
MVEFTFFVVARAIRVFTDRAKYGRQHALDFNKGVVRSHAHQDFPCERGENVTKQGLITSVPSSVVGISLLNNRITRLYLDCLDRHLVGTYENIFKLHRANGRKDLGTPEPVIGLG